VQPPPTIVRAHTTNLFGRCEVEAGDNRFPVDHPPVQEGPGEHPGTIDHFLAGVASCGVLMLEYQAKLREIPLLRLDVRIDGYRGQPGDRVPDRTLFDRVAMHFEFVGPTEDQAEVLVDHYKRH
jgi:uncharacterized OsmC-like protein